MRLWAKNVDGHRGCKSTLESFGGWGFKSLRAPWRCKRRAVKFNVLGSWIMKSSSRCHGSAKNHENHSVGCMKCENLCCGEAWKNMKTKGMKKRKTAGGVHEMWKSMLCGGMKKHENCCVRHEKTWKLLVEYMKCENLYCGEAWKTWKPLCRAWKNVKTAGRVHEM